MRLILRMWLQWLLQAIAPAAGGWFTKQCDYLNAAYLNDVNDAQVGGQIQSVPSGITATQGQQTQPGDRIILDDATASALSDTAVGTLYGGIYCYVQATWTTQAAAVGGIAFFRAADVGNLTPTSPATTSYVAFGDAQPLTTLPTFIFGVFINVLTKNNYGWIQIAGVASVLFDSTVSSTVTGNLVVAKASASVASTADNTTITNPGAPLIAAIIGVAVGTVATSVVSKVAITRGLGRL
jgi:hypothetical protein